LRSPELWLSLCLVRPMRARTLTTAIFVCLLASTIADEEKPLERLHYALRHMDNPGDVIYQAQLDGLDYRAHLRRAIVKDRRSLAALFDYTENGQLMGVGAEEHCEVLYNLLQVWGDTSFANVLQGRDRRVRHRVIPWIASQFPYPGWRPYQFPQTYKLGPHD